MAQQPVVFSHGPNPLFYQWLKPTWLPKVQVQPAPDHLGDNARPCLVWLGARTYDGYGQVWTGGGKKVGKAVYLHRRSWEEANGQVLGKNDGHHLCYVRNCFEATHIAKASLDDNRGPTQFKAKCPVPDEELLALHNLYAYEMESRRM